MYSIEGFEFILKDVFLYATILWVFYEFTILKKIEGVPFGTLILLAVALSIRSYYFYVIDKPHHWLAMAISMFFCLLLLIHIAKLYPIWKIFRPKIRYRTAIFMLEIQVLFLIFYVQRHYSKNILRLHPITEIYSRYIEAFVLLMTITNEVFKKCPFVPLMMAHYLLSNVYVFYFEWPEKREGESHNFWACVYKIVAGFVGVMYCTCFLCRNYDFSELCVCEQASIIDYSKIDICEYKNRNRNVDYNNMNINQGDFRCTCMEPC